MQTSPTVFSMFCLPRSERLAALRAHLDAGVALNSIDDGPHQGESVLGRVILDSTGTVDLTLVKELMDRGVNPFQSQMRTGHDGSCSVWQGLIFNALTTVNSLDPHLTAELLSGCLKHDHRNPEGYDVLNWLVDISACTACSVVLPVIEQAIKMGFPLDQPFDEHPNVVHQMIAEHSRRAAAPFGQPFNGIWDVAVVFVEAGIDMEIKDAAGRSGWDLVDAFATQFDDSAVYRRIRAHRHAATLESDTAPATGSRPQRRM